MKGFVLRRGEGRRYNWYGYEFIVKAGHPETQGAAGFMEFVTERGQEPRDHVHEGEDEVFVVLEGSLTVRCGDGEFAAEVGDFVFLPRDVQHSFTVRSDRARVFVVTAPDDFSRKVESDGERLRR